MYLLINELISGIIWFDQSSVQLMKLSKLSAGILTVDAALFPVERKEPNLHQ